MLGVSILSMFSSFLVYFGPGSSCPGCFFFPLNVMNVALCGSTSVCDISSVLLSSAVWRNSVRNSRLSNTHVYRSTSQHFFAFLDNFLKSKSFWGLQPVVYHSLLHHLSALDWSSTLGWWKDPSVLVAWSSIIGGVWIKTDLASGLHQYMYVQLRSRSRSNIIHVLFRDCPEPVHVFLRRLQTVSEWFLSG